jgi:hypothetical protein
MKHYGTICRVAVGVLVAIAGIAIARAGRADAACGSFSDVQSNYAGNWNTNQSVAWNSHVYSETSSGGSQTLTLYLGQQVDECDWDWAGVFFGTKKGVELCVTGIDTQQNPNGFGTSVSNIQSTGTDCDGSDAWNGSMFTCECPR